jgi:sugar diacid utilization regulator
MLFKKNISRLDLRDQMRYEPENGKLFIKDSRMIIQDTYSLGLLRKDLINYLGFDRAKGFMFRYGWHRGVHNVQLVTREYEFNEDIDWLMAGPKMNEMQGMAKIEIEEAFIDRKSGRFFVATNWHDSYEAEEYLKHFGKSYQPVCATMAGYASGFVSTYFNKQVIYKEVKCKAMGAPYCQVVGNTVDSWGHEVADELKYINNFNLVHSLDQVYQKLEKQRDILRISALVQRKLMKHIVRGEGLDKICSTLSDLLDVPVIIESDDFLPIAYERMSEGQAWGYSNSLKKLAEDHSKLPNHAYSFNRMIIHYEPVVLEIPDYYGVSHRRVITPIFLRDKLFGYISIISDDYSLDEKNLSAVERATWACSLYLMQERTALELEQRMLGNVLDEIFSDQMDREKVINKGKLLGFDLNMPGYVCLIEGEKEENTLLYNKELIQKIRGRVEFDMEKCLITEKSGYLMLLLPEKIIHRCGLTLKSIAQKILITLNQSNQNKWRMGISNRYTDVSQISRAFYEAKQALNMKKHGQVKEPIIFYKDLGILGILIKYEYPEEIRRFAEEKLGRLFDYDRRKGAELTKTLYYYLLNDCNMYKTAEELCLSLSGFRYRMRRIYELYQGDLDRSEERMQIYFALKYLIVTNQLDI